MYIYVELALLLEVFNDDPASTVPRPPCDLNMGIHFLLSIASRPLCRSIVLNSYSHIHTAEKIVGCIGWCREESFYERLRGAPTRNQDSANYSSIHSFCALKYRHIDRQYYIAYSSPPHNNFPHHTPAT